ncbi:MAG: amidohydrolase [Deltaproteobacteria bacterium]|nr:amidohydrolase [Deltaproteobacteria bacterium]MBW2076874.1 amidohydrolase [Deltaproteobacteria bacterium]MBW2311672.1 amidohydrolase [Deltaproteobacteria bacterium]
MTPQLLQMAFDLENRLIQWRRDFHMYPELGFREFRTSKRILEELTRLNIQAAPGIGGTGVVGLIRGEKKGKTIALRADMDALPITEENEVPYRSRNSGVMHACGHDAHMSILLGAAAILARLRQSLRGTIKLIFQPGEEIPEGGASTLICQGVLKNPAVHAIVGLHLLPRFPSGMVAIKEGVITAATDQIEICITGKSGHAARPYEAVDSIVIASQVISSIQAIVTRETDALDPKVVSIGRIWGGEAHNVIAKEVTMSGTIRTFSKETRRRVQRLIKKRCESIARDMGAKAEVKITRGNPPQINHPGLFMVLKAALSDSLGKERLIEYQTPSLGGEDFAFYSEKVPGFFFLLGCGDDKPGINKALHSSCFDFDESILTTGAAAMACCAVALTERKAWLKTP